MNGVQLLNDSLCKNVATSNSAIELKTNEMIYLHSAEGSAMRFFARGCYGADVKVIQEITREIHGKNCLGYYWTQHSVPCSG